MSDAGPNGCTCGHNGDCNCPFVPSAGEPEQPKKKRKRVSPTALTLAECRRRGWEAGVVEKPWNPHTKKTQDLFGVLDLVVIVPGHVVPAPDLGKRSTPGAILGIQTTTGSGTSGGGGRSARREKIIAEPRMVGWIRGGARLELWTWGQPGGRGSRWHLHVERFGVMNDGTVAVIGSE